MSDRDARITMAMVIARMVHPSSERAALNWLETNSATLELLRLDTGKGLKLDKLYRLGDVLVKHHRTIEDALFARQRKLFGTGGAVIFYDLTNTHMTGRPASKLARFGRSRQKRNDCPLGTLALATIDHLIGDCDLSQLEDNGTGMTHNTGTDLDQTQLDGG